MLDLVTDLFPLCPIEGLTWFYGDNVWALKLEHDTTGRSRHWNGKYARSSYREIPLTRSSNTFMEKNSQFIRIEVRPFKKILNRFLHFFTRYSRQSDCHTINPKVGH
jgi:hypothetical protein